MWNETEKYFFIFEGRSKLFIGLYCSLFFIALDFIFENYES